MRRKMDKNSARRKALTKTVLFGKNKEDRMTNKAQQDNNHRQAHHQTNHTLTSYANQNSCLIVIYKQ